MADDADRAQRIADEDLARRLVHRKVVPDIRPKGRCHFCHEPVESPKLFCDHFCSEDFERERRQRGML